MFAELVTNLSTKVNNQGSRVRIHIHPVRSQPLPTYVQHTHSRQNTRRHLEYSYSTTDTTLSGATFVDKFVTNTRSSRSGMQPKTTFLIPHLATNQPTTLTLTLHYREAENYGLSLKEMNQHNVSDMERHTTIVRIINGTVHTKVTSVSSWSANKTKLRSTPMKK